MKRTVLLFLLVFSLFLTSCKKEESIKESSITISDMSKTEVQIKVVNQLGVEQEGYVVMMFDQEVQENKPLPPILKQLLTDKSGLVTFDLRNMILENEVKTYYFEVFTKISNGYIYESLFHTKFELEKGSCINTCIVVK